MNSELEAYARGDSPVHRWSPRAKLAGLGLLILGYATVQSLALVPVILGVTLGLYGLSGLPLGVLRSRLRYPGLFLLGVVIVLPLVSGQTVLWHWGPLALRQEGLMMMALIASRFFAIITTGIVLLGSTPFLELVRAMRALGLPPLLADMTLLAYRYLFDISDQLSHLRQAMRLRGFMPQRATRRVMQPLAAVAGTLLIRSYEQSQRVYQAMQLRGYGQAASTPRLGWGQTRDILGLAGCGLIAFLLMLAQWTGFPP